jgi:predicted MFS family arabinose efflux permease
MFLGMAIGSAVGSWLFAAGGWTALTTLSTASAMGALVVRLRERCRTAAK